MSPSSRTSRADPLTVGVGLVVLGASSYFFLALTARALGPSQFGGLSSLYVLVYTVGPGIFLGLEQEVARATAAARAQGLGSRSIVRRASRAGAVGALVATAVLALSFPLLRRLLADDDLLVVGFLASVPAFAGAYLSRGVLAGRGQLARYSWQLGLEGALRLAACAVVLALGSRSPGELGLLFAGATAAGVLLTLPRREPGDPPDDPGHQALSRALVPLTLATLASQVLANLAPLIVTGLTASTDRDLVGRFMAAFVVVRVPLFLFAAVQVTYLPRLAAQVGARDRAGFGSSLRAVCSVILVVTAALTAGAGLIGRGVVKLVFGAGFALDGSELAVLAAATGLFAVTTVLAQALIALRHYQDALAGWVTGIVVVLGVLTVHASVPHLAEAGFLIGCLAASACHGTLTLRAIRSWGVPQ